MAGGKSDIVVKVTADTAQAQAGLKSLGGATNTLKGTIGSLVSKVPGLNKIIGPNLAGSATQGAAGLTSMATAGVAAGGALVAFGVKAVDAFTGLAKSALDGAAATGLSTEQFSRWAAVADDAEVSSEQLATGIGKIAKNIDGAVWERYGIATKDASGETRDANDILLDAFDKLGQITNETDRATAGTELFGKSYANLAPLIGKTREEYEGMLGTVEDGQVITAGEAESAERMRLAQDHLADSLKEVSLQAGAALAELAPLVDLLANLGPLASLLISDVVSPFSDLTTNLEGLTRSTNGVTVASSEYSDGLALVRLRQREVWEETVKQMEAQWELEQAQSAGTEASAVLAEQIEIVTKKEKEAKDAADAHAKAIKAYNDRLQERIDLEQEQYDAARRQLDGHNDLIGTLYDLEDAQKEYDAELGKGEMTKEESDRSTHELAQKYIEAAEEAAEASGAIDGSKESLDYQLGALNAVKDALTPGSPLIAYLEQYIALLGSMPTTFAQPPSLPTGPMGTRSVTPVSVVPVGNPGIRSRGGTTVGQTNIYNFHPSAPTPSQVRRAEQEYQRVNGS